MQTDTNRSNVKSNIFGGGDDKEQGQSRVPGRTQDNIFGTAPPPVVQDGQKEEEDEDKDKEEGVEGEKTEQPVKAEQPKFKGRGQFNPITGEPYDTQPPVNKDLHTSTRVKQPPGGASTKLW
jgi:hypothetical protein